MCQNRHTNYQNLSIFDHLSTEHGLSKLMNFMILWGTIQFNMTHTHNLWVWLKLWNEINCFFSWYTDCTALKNCPRSPSSIPWQEGLQNGK